MARHPDIVPGEHCHREKQDARIEEFLARAFEQRGNLACEGSDETSARDASDYAVADPEAPARHALGCGEHDADDEPGLDDLAKNDQKRSKHSSLPFRYFAIRVPLVSSS